MKHKNKQGIYNLKYKSYNNKNTENDEKQPDIYTYMCVCMCVCKTKWRSHIIHHTQMKGGLIEIKDETRTCYTLEQLKKNLYHGRIFKPKLPQNQQNMYDSILA